MAESVTVEVVVDERVKTRWKHHAETRGEYDHLSDLVRTAVSKQIERDNSDDADEVPDGIQNMFYDIETQYERLEGLLMSANQSLETLEGSRVTQDDIEETIEFHTSRIESALGDMQDDADADTDAVDGSEESDE